MERPAEHPVPAAPTPRCVHVHFTVGARRETALFRTDTPDEQLKDLFRSAAEAGPRDILKLYNNQGSLMNISSELPANTPLSPYTLQVVAAHSNGSLPDDVGLDLRTLETRIAELEKQLRLDHDSLPPSVQDLRHQVDNFRQKLETTETLSWLGFYKQLPEPLSTDECRRLQYRRKSDSIKKRVKENFLNICDSTLSEQVQHCLRMPTFDSRQWEDEELLLLLQQMFIDLELCSKLDIDIRTLRNFIYEVYKNYNEVPFHNFRHCFCVSQMMYAIACYVDLPSKIGVLETLILLTSSICHDLDHPGYNNIYQINAKTELALRYNDISPLENHHCSIAFRILENQDCNIFKSFSSDTFKQVREGMIRCILATDMARHNEILAHFKDITPCFDYSNKIHVNSLCMVLIKVADISNEARPMDVAEPWLDRLLQEFFKQSDAEKLEGLPVTPFMDRDKITKPSSQCSFIGFVLLPLFEALGELLTELQDLIVQPVRDALEYYRRLNEATKEERMHRKSVVAELLLEQSSLASIHSSDTTGSTTVPKSGSNYSVRSKRSISFGQNRTRSRSMDEDQERNNDSLSDDEQCNLAEVAEDTESGDSETATEVEVSEKTLKFKISTEGSVSSGRKSYPGSRKGSREKGQQLNCVEIARAVQTEKERRRLMIGGGQSFDQRILVGKKLSFDTTELFDDHTKRYLKQFCRRISHDEYGCRNADDSGDSPIDRLRSKRNSTHAISILKHSDNSRPCEKVEISKQNNIWEERKMDVEKIIPTPNENGDKCYGDICNKDSCKLENNKTVSNSCKYDKISVDSDSKKNKESTESDNEEPKLKSEQHTPEQRNEPEEEDHAPEQLSPNGNRSILSRLKQFTDRLGLSIDKDSSKLRSLFSLKNNNGTRMTLPTRYRGNKKEENPPCCKMMDPDEDMKSNTLPKASKVNTGVDKKGWRQRLTLGRDRGANSLDSFPPSSPIKNAGDLLTSVASTSHTQCSSSDCNLPMMRCDLVEEKMESPLGPLEPDQHVLESSIELM